MKETLTINEKELIAFAQNLVRIPSLSYEEKDVALAIKAEMEKLEYDEVIVDKWHNVVGIIKGSGGGKSLMLNGHIDHAAVGDMEDPFSARIMDGRVFGTEGQVLYGRAAVDMKGAIASMVYAGAAVKRGDSSLRGDVIVACNTTEEVSTAEGINYILEEDGIKADMAICGEATNLNVYIGHRGMLEVEITVKGRTSHASNPSNGINAIFKAAELITRFEDWYSHYPEDALLGKSTITFTDIVASPGRGAPIVPDRCVFYIDLRFQPGERVEDLTAEVQKVVDRAKKEIPDFDAKVKITKIFPGLFTPEDSDITKAVLKARKNVMGDEGQVSTWIFGTDGAYIAQKDISCIGFGPGDEQFAHTPQDHISLEHLITAAKVYVQTALIVCE